MKLLAISDLHLGHVANRHALERIGDHPADWLILAGDVGEWPAHLEFALGILVQRFRRIIWAPGNHDLWTSSNLPTDSRGQARYDELVALCRGRGVLTPEDPYIEWPPDPGTFVVPMFLLFDYSFRPADVPYDGAVAWARQSGVVCSDEHLLDPDPWPSRSAWCHARCAETAARLERLPAGARTILINHWPLRTTWHGAARPALFDLVRTVITEDWDACARAVVSGHLHLRTTLWRHGVRYDEVSLGYPRDWRQERGIDWYLREILPDPPSGARRFVPARDPFHL
jgi:3',5'-cyclic AMP phosphodiesterase CpdA